MHCMDTDVIIDFLRGKPDVVKAIKGFSADGVSTTCLNVCELYKGAFLSATPDEVVRVADFLRNVDVLGIDEKAARIYGSIFALLKAQGAIKQEFDMLIAAICISHGQKLVTRNVKDFSTIPGIALERI